jgi:hypothetical protein
LYKEGLAYANEKILKDRFKLFYWLLRTFGLRPSAFGGFTSLRHPNILKIMGNQQETEKIYNSYVLVGSSETIREAPLKNKYLKDEEIEQPYLKD